MYWGGRKETAILLPWLQTGDFVRFGDRRRSIEKFAVDVEGVHMNGESKKWEGCKT